MAEEEVSISSLVDDAGFGAKALGPLQRVGFDLARIVLVIIAATMIVIFIVAFAAFPLGQAPAPPANPTTDSVNLYKSSLDAYKALSDAQIGRATSLFTAIVGTALLPAFTAILGYIFGKTQEGGEQD